MSTDPQAAATLAPAARQPRPLPGVEGVWVFVFAEMAVFALMFGCFIWDRQGNQALYEASQHALSRNFGGIKTLILLTSSMLVVLAVNALRQGRARLAPLLFGLAAACGAGFIVSKVLEYSHKFEAGIGLTTNDFFMYYFIMTGMHLGHVVVGTVVVTVLAFKARTATPGGSLAL